MILFDVIKREDNSICGFGCSGHAGYAENGHDIVCSAVSALVINCINSIDEFCKDDEITVTTDEKTGTIRCFFSKPMTEGCQLLVDSLILGVTSIERSYGKQYIQVKR